MTSKKSITYFVYIISFLDLFAVGLTWPLLSPSLRDLGISHYIIGLLGSLYSGTQVISGPLIGAWSDVRGKKSVLKITLLACAFFYFLMGTTTFMYLIFLVRFGLGIVKHTQTICKAVITENLPVNEQSGILGRSAAWGSIGFIIGPFLSGHLSELPNGFFYVCTITSILFIFNFFVTLYLPENTSRTQIQSSENVLNNFKEELKKTVTNLREIEWKVHWRSLLLRFLFGFTISSYFTSQSLFLKEKYLLPQRYINYTTSFYSTIGTTSAFFLNKISKFYTNDVSCYKRLLHFFAIIFLALCGIHFTTNLTVFFILLAPLATASTVTRIVSMELMLKESKKSQNGSLSGASNSIMSVARFFTPLLGGWFAGTFGEENSMLLAVVPAFVGLLITLYLNIYENKMKTK